MPDTRRGSLTKRRSVAAMVSALALVIVVVAPANAARARPATVESLGIISGGSGPLGECQLQDWKLEVNLAASPADPQRLTAAWQQGVRSTDEFEILRPWTIMSATSTDGGATWTRQPVPGLNACTGNSNLPPEVPGLPGFATDQHVSIGPDGIAYASSVVVKPVVPMGCCGSVYVNRSRDGGLHWDSPVVVDGPIYREDFPPVTADPKIPGRAYLAWDRNFEPPSLMFSSTTDGGVTWSPGTVAQLAPPGHLFDLDGAPVVVMPDSSLLLFYVDHSLTELAGLDTQKQLVVRSTDGGRSWSAPVKVAELASTTGKHTVAAAPDGSLYMAWADPGAGKVLMVRSVDTGRSWSVPRMVANEPGAQIAAIAVDRHGRPAVTWYDSRNGAGTTADAWFAYSRDHGSTWMQTHLGGPFDLNTTAFPSNADNPPVGGYEGLVATPDGFAAAFVMGQPQADNGPTDVFFARIRL